MKSFIIILTRDDVNNIREISGELAQSDDIKILFHIDDLSKLKDSPTIIKGKRYIYVDQCYNLDESGEMESIIFLTEDSLIDGGVKDNDDMYSMGSIKLREIEPREKAYIALENIGMNPSDYLLTDFSDCSKGDFMKFAPDNLLYVQMAKIPGREFKIVETMKFIEDNYVVKKSDLSFHHVDEMLEKYLMSI